MVDLFKLWIIITEVSNNMKNTFMMNIVILIP